MAVYIVTVPDADRQMQAVEVSLEVYQVFIDGHRAEQRERYERRKHLDSRPLECCLYGKSVSETLEETFERMELTEKVWAGLSRLSPKQRQRLILHFWYRSEKISKIFFENMTTFGRFPSYIVRGTFRAFHRTLINSGFPFISAFRNLSAVVSTTK